MPEPADMNAAAERIETLLGELSDPDSRTKAEELVRVLMEVYGAGLARILELISEAGEGGKLLLDRITSDKLVASLLLVHGLHPLDAETRVREALAPIERRLKGQHLIYEGIEGGVARVRIDANGSGAVQPGLAEAIERALIAAAPDLDGVKVETPAKLVQIGLAPGA